MSIIIASTQAQDVYVSGRLSLSTGFNKINGIDPRKPAFSYVLNGNPTLHIGKFQLPFGLLLSNYQRSFSQPFNQFGLSPTFHGVTFHLGHRSITWSKYSLGGHRFFGLGGETQLGKFRLGFIKGRFLNATRGNTTSSPISPIMAFTRNGYAVKLGLGLKNNHFDIIYFKAKDDTTSLDSIEKIKLKPKENAILGLKGAFRIKKNLRINIDFGVSGLSRDLSSPSLKLDTSNNLVRFAKKVLNPNISTQINFAREVSFAYKGQKFGVDIKHKNINPGYTSLGSYYLRTDLNQNSIGGYLSFIKNKYYFRVRYGQENDNVKNQKLQTTNRTIYSINAMLRPVSPFNLMLQYSNFGVSQKSKQVSISDTTQLNNITKSLVISPNLSFKIKSIQQNLNLIYSNQILNDQNKYTVAYTTIKSKTYNINYSTSTKNSWSGNIGWNRTNSKISAGKTQSNGLSLSVNKSYLKVGLSIGAMYFYSKNKYNNTSNGHTSRLSTNISYTLSRNHLIRFDFYQLTNQSSHNEVSKSFIEKNIRMTYSYRFSTKKAKK